MAKKLGADYQKVCIFCENATVLKGTGDILCKHKGIVSEDYVCRKYVYDPLKRQPKAPLKIQTLSQEDLI